MPPKKRGPAPGSEEAKRGGQAIRAKYGSEYFRQLGLKSVQSVRGKRTPAFYEEIGRKGGEITKAKYGLDYYRRIGKAGGEKGRKSTV
jgi:general stress protein YciG